MWALLEASMGYTYTYSLYLLRMNISFSLMFLQSKSFDYIDVYVYFPNQEVDVSMCIFICLADYVPSLQSLIRLLKFATAIQIMK